MFNTVQISLKEIFEYDHMKITLHIRATIHMK